MCDGGNHKGCDQRAFARAALKLRGDKQTSWTQYKSSPGPAQACLARLVPAPTAPPARRVTKRFDTSLGPNLSAWSHTRRRDLAAAGSESLSAGCLQAPLLREHRSEACKRVV